MTKLQVMKYGLPRVDRHVVEFDNVCVHLNVAGHCVGMTDGRAEVLDETRPVRASDGVATLIES